MARLSRLTGRGRALEILLVADDLDGARAEQYGYINRAITDSELDETVESIASRLAFFDHEAIARTKFHVDQATLPSDAELAAALPEFFSAFGRPGPQARSAVLARLGLNTDSDLERNLGTRVVEAAPNASPAE
jgi:enoyl-CoA hydratase/carnithine racemase